MHINPEQIWKKIWSNSDCDIQLLENIWNEIHKSYSSKSRYYHNMAHIIQILEAVNEYSAKIQDISTMQLAAYFHDIIYSPKRKDNEVRSAALAVKKLMQLNYPSVLIEKCKQYILATKDHSNSLMDNDLDFLLDFDLEKLGAAWPEYLEYTRQIRKEYKIYPDIIYIPGRKKVLAHFLNLNRIYKTPAFYEKYELQARQNMEREMEQLQ